MGIYRQFPYSNFHEMNLDEIIKIVKNMLEEWAQYYTEWDDWKTQVQHEWDEMVIFINNYFDNLDVQEEINNKIVSMVNSGEFGQIVQPYLPSEVASWLADHITQPVGVVIDTSLSVSGACADAQITGDDIRLLADECLFLAFGEVADNTVILSANDVNVGDVIYYDFDTNVGFTGYLAIYDSPSHVAQEIGKGSSASAVNHYEGTFTVFEGFHHITAKATAPGETSTIFINRFTTKWIGEIYDLFKFACSGTSKSLDPIKEVEITSDDFINCRFDNLSALTRPTYKIIKDPNNIICSFIKVAKGDKVHIETGGLYARAFYFSDIYSFSDYQSNFYDEDTVYTCPDDGFVSVMMRVDASATTAIVPADFDNNSASITIEHVDAVKFNDVLVPMVRIQAYYAPTQIKNRTVPFDGYTYLAFSTGAFYNRKEIHVCRAGMEHDTPEDNNDWGKLLFIIINEDGTKDYKYLDRPLTFNYEMRDPNLVVTRENKLILSGFGIRVENGNNVIGSYMLMLSIDDDNEITIVDSLFNYVTSGECVWGNTIEDSDGYLYKCTYGADSDTTIKIYKSTTTLGTSNTLPTTYQLFASYTGNTEITEPTISIYNDEIIFAIVRREAVAPLIIIFDDSGNVLGTMELGGNDGNVLHAPVLLPYYTTPHIIYSASQKTVYNYRHPIVGVFDIRTGRVITSRYVLFTPSYGGYTSLVPIGQNNYGITYYIDIHSGTDSGFYYQRINVERFLNWYWV